MAPSVPAGMASVNVDVDDDCKIICVVPLGSTLPKEFSYLSFHRFGKVNLPAGQPPNDTNRKVNAVTSKREERRCKSTECTAASTPHHITKKRSSSAPQMSGTTAPRARSNAQLASVSGESLGLQPTVSKDSTDSQNTFKAPATPADTKSLILTTTSSPIRFDEARNIPTDELQNCTERRTISNICDTDGDISVPLSKPSIFAAGNSIQPPGSPTLSALKPSANTADYPKPTGSSNQMGSNSGLARRVAPKSITTPHHLASSHPKRTQAGDSGPADKRQKLTARCAIPSSNPHHSSPTSPTAGNSTLWSIPAYDPSNDPNLDNDSRNAEAANTVTPPLVPKAAKPRPKKFTAAILSDFAGELESCFDFAGFAAKHGMEKTQIYDVFSNYVYMPIFRFSERGMSRIKLAEFERSMREYKQLEKRGGLSVQEYKENKKRGLGTEQHANDADCGVHDAGYLLRPTKKKRAPAKAKNSMLATAVGNSFEKRADGANAGN